jgi:hypothetical protein
MRPAAFAAAIAVCAPVFAQVRVDWAALQGARAGSSEKLGGVAVDPTGAVYVAGSTDSPQGSGRLLVAKYASDGTPSWTRTHDTSLGGAVYVYAAALDGAGSFYVAGTATDTAHPTHWYPMVLKYSTDGTLLWARVFRRESGGFVALAFAASSRVLLLGGPIGPPFELSMTAVDAQGQLLWETRYAGGPNEDVFAQRLAVAPNGDVVAVGTVRSSGGYWDIRPLIVRVNPRGEFLWTRRMDDPGIAYGDTGDVVLDPADISYVALRISASAQQPWAIGVAAFDAHGNELWVRTLPGASPASYTIASGIALDPFGRVVVAGSAAFDSAVGVFERDGTFVWSRLLDDPGGSGAGSVEFGEFLGIDATGNIWLAGSTYSSSNFWTADYFAIQYDPQGELRCATRYSLPPVRGHSIDWMQAAALAPSGGIVVAGMGQTAVSPDGLDIYDGLVVQWSRTAHAICPGDGSAASCPCGNASAPVESAGCRNSSGAGARLLDAGASSLADDTLELRGTSLAGSQALFFQGTSAGSAVPYGDGLRCVGGAIVRLGVSPVAGGEARFPSRGDPSISARGGVVAPGSRAYQIAYRDPAGACGGTAWNFTNGLLVDWIP